MGDLKTKVKTLAKKEVAKEIGRQVEKIIKRNVNYADPRALRYAGEFAEKTALRAMGVKTSQPAKSSSTTSKQKSSEFGIKVSGMEKVAKEGLQGKNIGRAIRNNAKIEATLTIRWGKKK